MSLGAFEKTVTSSLSCLLSPSAEVSSGRAAVGANEGAASIASAITEGEGR